MISIRIITKIADGIQTCTTVTEWVGVGTATILGMIPGTILGIMATDITIAGIALGTAVGTRPGITVAGTAHGIRLGITAVFMIPGTTVMVAGTVADITVTAAGMAADTTVVSTMDTTLV